MFLMDMVSQCAIRLKAMRRTDPLQGYADMADRLPGTPRFILDSNACRTAVELNLGRPKITLQAMSHLTIPYPRMWVEWDDSDRQKLRDRFDEPLTFAELRPMPGKVGYLLETDNGRRGRVSWAWTTPSGSPDIPNVGAMETHFDLDRIFPMQPAQVESLLEGNLAKLWLDNPVQLEALLNIWSTCTHEPTHWAEDFWRCLPDPALGRALSHADVAGEYMMVWAVVLLLTASRPVVDLTEIDLSRLNKQRSKRGTPPLLDHTRVSLYLQPQEHRPIVHSPLGYMRKSPRVHMVSSYLARRGTKHWITQPYFRGSGRTIHRVTTVRG